MDPAKRTNFQDVTETLVRAMERAEEMEHVVVLYQAKESTGRTGGIFTQNDVTLSQMNWLFDLGKAWLIQD
jgi:hypothetical protein